MFGKTSPADTTIKNNFKWTLLIGIVSNNINQRKKTKERKTLPGDSVEAVVGKTPPGCTTETKYKNINKLNKILTKLCKESNTENI